MTMELIDECFTVEETKWKTWNSYDKNQKKLITSLDRESCINATRFYLKGIQDGWDNDSSTKYQGVVESKL